MNYMPLDFSYQIDVYSKPTPRLLLLLIEKPLLYSRLQGEVLDSL